MVTIEDAQKIGINACINMLGRDFVREHRISATSAYATDTDENGNVFCFVGVADHAAPNSRPDVLVLDNISQFPYRASCNVAIADGSITVIEKVGP